MKISPQLRWATVGLFAAIFLGMILRGGRKFESPVVPTDKFAAPGNIPKGGRQDSASHGTERETDVYGPGDEDASVARLCQYYLEDPDETLAALGHLPEAAQRRVVGDMASMLTKVAPAQAARLYFSIAHPESELMAEAPLLVDRWAAIAPREVTAWVNGMPDNLLRDLAVGVTVRRWAMTEPMVAQVWLKGFPGLEDLRALPARDQPGP